MRPVNKPPNNVHYNPDDDLNFGFPNASRLCRLYNFKDETSFLLPPGAALNILLQYVKKPSQNLVAPNQTTFPLPQPHTPRASAQPLTLPEQKGLREAIQNKVTDVYKTAAAPMTQDLGDYCSYCGTPLPGLVEVEHTVPKSQYPTFTVSWENFLLSCGPCNTAKSDTPTRAIAKPWTGQADPTEDQYYDAIRVQSYMWPDLNATCWEDMPMQLEYVNPADANWYVLDIDDSTNLNNRLTGYDVVDHKVYADISINGVMHYNYQVAVTVTSSTQNGEDMENLMKFNNDVTNPLTGTYDRRVMNRTRAWFYALEKVKVLETAKNQNEFMLLWPQVPILGAASGFYSVWLTVLDQFNDFIGTQYSARFVIDTNHPMMFPNTNPANLPT